MTKKMFFLFLFFLLLSSIVVADMENTIHLLTVSEGDNETLIGGVASLELIITSGSGSIFIESFPLSNVDTQAITRIATDIACSYTDVDCNTKNFFYTIRTNSGFVRGPSAGGATALLALSTLEGIHLPEMAMTGGISSGGLITPVGGVKEKVGAAIREEIELIVVPNLVFNITYNLSENETDNETYAEPLFLEDLQSEEGTVHGVSSLPEVYSLVTGNHIPQKVIAQPPTYYTQKMKETSELLCQRSQELFDELKSQEVSNSSLDYYNKSLTARAQGDYYSSASFCYSANIQLRKQLVDNLSVELLEENLLRLTSSLSSFEEQIDSRDLKTFSDLEAYIIVKERLYEANEYIGYINQTNISTRLLSLAIERYYSAVAWSGFFGLDGKPLLIDETSLELACIQELREVEARSNYLKVTLPIFFLEEIQSQLDAAYEHYNNNNYPLCIFKASKAKASAHIFMNDIQMDEQLVEILAVKSQRVQEIIHDQQEEGIFPIIGYSYYEYAQQLQVDQPYTSLLFTEYALAMSDLNTYFPKAPLISWSILESTEILFLVAGMVIGFTLSFLGGFNKPKHKKRRKKFK